MPELHYADPGFFQRRYERDPDPWRLNTSDYERQKGAATLDALPPGCYQRGLEIGCGVGVLTRQLAATCDTLLAVDIAPQAVRQAERFCEDLPWVHFADMDVRTAWPEGHFDLILFSEVLYHLGLDGIDTVAGGALHSLAPGGSVLLVNSLDATGADCTGDAAAEHFIAASRPRLVPIQQRRTEHYRIDVLR
jgi:2-polyprenyl-3-methyl-5-hydroxy-6-metoxy-1,4-benzoquinol methylase